MDPGSFEDGVRALHARLEAEDGIEARRERSETTVTTPAEIPEAVKNIVQRSIATVKAFRDLRRAGEEKASEPARAKYRKALQTSLVELDRAVSAWKPSSSSGPGFDWAGFFRTATRGLDLVRDLKNGKVGAREARSFVEAEVLDMKTPRGR